MKAMLYGGRCDGEVVDLGDVEIAPPTIVRYTLTSKEMEELAATGGSKTVPVVEYRNSQRIRSDGCALYVLKGATL